LTSISGEQSPSLPCDEKYGRQQEKEQAQHEEQAASAEQQVKMKSIGRLLAVARQLAVRIFWQILIAHNLSADNKCRIL
jgi:hypothetical protein